MSASSDNDGGDSSSTATVTTYLITGASRGLGQAIAVEAAAATAAGTDGAPSSIRFVLVARSQEGLQETERAIRSNLVSGDDDVSAVPTSCHVMDLVDLETLEAGWDVVLQDLNLDDCDTRNHLVIFINNAGSLGHLGPCSTTPSLKDMQQTIDLNVTSSLWLSVRLVRYIKGQRTIDNTATTTVTIVNISSLTAISNDFVTMGIYSAGKGARDKYHTIMAKEEEAESAKNGNEGTASCIIKTLNYAPGPLETNMTQELRNASHLDKSLQENFNKPLLDVRDSAKKLIRLLRDNSFESGAHVDYYDLPDNE